MQVLAMEMILFAISLIEPTSSLLLIMNAVILERDYVGCVCVCVCVHSHTPQTVQLHLGTHRASPAVHTQTQVGVGTRPEGRYITNTTLI